MDQKPSAISGFAIGSRVPVGATDHSRPNERALKPRLDSDRLFTLIGNGLVLTKQIISFNYPLFNIPHAVCSQIDLSFVYRIEIAAKLCLSDSILQFCVIHEKPVESFVSRFHQFRLSKKRRGEVEQITHPFRSPS